MKNVCAADMPLDLSPEARALAEENVRYGSEFATKDESIIRRDMSKDVADILRPAFSRDVDKILHMKAYNRLAGKTQVFSFRAHDDLCRRGLHVQLVARVAREIGRLLGLNLDLIEAISLGHDLGHTPFGHAGEHFLNKIYKERAHKAFFHNVQSVRVMDKLAGRNVSLQVLDGALCHNGEFELQTFSTSNLSSFDEFDAIIDACWLEDAAQTIAHLRPMTIEGCVMRISDIIAYVGKDRQDAMRAGLTQEDSFDDGLGSAYNAWALRAFITDVVEHSIGKDHIEMSEAGFRELARAKRENYQKIYMTAEVNGDFGERIYRLFEDLYEYELEQLKFGNTDKAIFKHHIEPIQRELANYGQTYSWEDDLDRCVVDYISSMTDDYFMATCNEVFNLDGAFPSMGYFSEVRP